MKTRPLAAALLVAFALASFSLAFSGSAAAQPAADEASTKAARARFQEGVEFYDKGQFESARASFLQAYALRKHPAVLLNLAQSSLRSNHPLEASKFFQQFLRDAQGITVAQRETANTGLADARGRLGRIDVAAPPGTEVTIDGERVGTTPLAEAADVESGAHVVKGRMPDGRDETQSVSVTAGQRGTARFSAAAQPAPLVAPIAPPVTTPPPATPPPTVDAATTAPANVHPDGANVEDRASPSRHLTTKAPIWIGVGVAGVGVIMATVFAVAKGSAQDNANSVEKTIRNNGGGAGTCTSTDPKVVEKFGRACAALADNRSTVDTDAALANVGIGLAVVGGVTAAAWAIFGPRVDDAPATGFRSLKPAPIYTRDTTGFSLSGSF